MALETKKRTHIKGLPLNEYYRGKRKEYYHKRLEQEREASKKFYRSKREKILERCRLYRQKRRKLVIDTYGGKCVCCEEKNMEFLSIDHINGGGTKERLKSKMSSSEFYRKIVKEKFPNIYRVLCHNCNQSFGFYGYCPHGRGENGN